MREQQTNPKQPRDEDGTPRGTEQIGSAEQEQPRDDERAGGAEGRDRAPAGRSRGTSPWLGGG